MAAWQLCWPPTIMFCCWCFDLSFLFSPSNLRGRSVDCHQILPHVRRRPCKVYKKIVRNVKNPQRLSQKYQNLLKFVTWSRTSPERNKMSSNGKLQDMHIVGLRNLVNFGLQTRIHDRRFDPAITLRGTVRRSIECSSLSCNVYNERGEGESVCNKDLSF